MTYPIPYVSTLSPRETLSLRIERDALAIATLDCWTPFDFVTRVAADCLVRHLRAIELGDAEAQRKTLGNMRDVAAQLDRRDVR
jgi:hypothetical protein